MPVDDCEAFIGMMLVHQNFRRQGIAKTLLERCIPTLGDRNISLYGSREAVALYRKYGFKSEENPTYIYEPTFLPNRDGLKGIKIRG